MIDVHCHLEQKDYDKDREEVIKRCIEKMDAVITSCAHPRDFDLTLSLKKKHPDFIYICIGLHPEYIKELKPMEKEELKENIKENIQHISAIGEIGLDYYWTKEEEWRDKQKDMFRELIDFAKELDKPIVVHSRDAHQDTLDILEEKNAKHVLLHLWGANQLVPGIIKNNWNVSFGPILLRSKKHKKICRDMPLEKIMLETDAPWFGETGTRNEPTSVKNVIARIAEIKGIDSGIVDNLTTENAKKFFRIG
ncbi:MAG: TatD family hydrolase [archaeon]